MDIKEYSYILAVVNAGSISEASKKLYISQPSLSMYIKNLEERLGFKFFHKSNGKLYLTDLGKIYISYAHQIVSLDASLHKTLESAKKLECGKIVMGIPATRSTMFLPKALPLFKKSYPNIEVQIIEDTSEHLEKLTRERNVDFSLMNQSQRPNGMQTMVIGKEQIVVAGPYDNPIVKMAEIKPGYTYKWIDLSALTKQYFILMKPGQHMRQAADCLFEQAGFQPKVLLETASVMTAYQLSAAGMGFFIITDSFCKAINDPNICYFSVGSPCISSDVIITYPDQEQLSTASKAMITILKEIYPNI